MKLTAKEMKESMDFKKRSWDEDKYMAKPIEATPILKGVDLVGFVESLSKKDSASSQAKREAALDMFRIATRRD